MAEDDVLEVRPHVQLSFRLLRCADHSSSRPRGRGRGRRRQSWKTGDREGSNLTGTKHQHPETGWTSETTFYSH